MEPSYTLALMVSHLLRGLTRAYLRADAGFVGVRQAALEAAGGFFASALTMEEQSAVSIGVYDAAFGRLPRRGLADWEKSWFARRLPAPPARVLVGAAGLGPEVLHLVEGGYAVDALEPARGAGSACAALGAESVIAARYEDLARAVLDGSEGPASALAKQRYDAVIIGWGSLSHVLDPRQRLRLLLACDRLAPRGPILASFLELVKNHAEPGRARATGSALGRLVRRTRGLGPCRVEDVDAVGFGSWFGFIHLFTAEEVEDLGRRISRKVIWEADHRSGYPHVSFGPVP